MSRIDLKVDQRRDGHLDFFEKICECVGCIILVVWVITHRNDLGKVEGQIDRYFHGKTDLLK